MKEFIDSLRQINYLKDKILSIYLKGSRQDMSQVDYWSDTDIIIVLKDDYKIIEELEHALDEFFSPIMAKELYVHKGGIGYRVITTIGDRIKQYDLQVLEDILGANYLKDEMTCIYGIDNSITSSIEPTQISNEVYNEKMIQEVWFKYFECVKKFSRNDNLIGMHLLFDLLKEYLVLNMVKRDIKTNTRVHRFGYSEKLQSNLDMNLLNSEKTTDKLGFILRLAKVYDDELAKLHSEYQTRYAVLELHIKASLEHLEQNN